MRRLLVFITASYPGIQVEMGKRDIASAFRLRRPHPELSFLMCAELPGNHFNFPTDFAFCYLDMPSGWNGAPANFAQFGDAVSAIHSHCGTTSPHWYRPFPFFSLLYVDDGVFYGRKIRRRQERDTSTWERITKGLSGGGPINGEVMRLEVNWGGRPHTYRI